MTHHQQRLLTVADVAERLQVSTSHVFSLIRRRRITTINISTNPRSTRKAYRISEESLNKFIANQLAESELASAAAETLATSKQLQQKQRRIKRWGGDIAKQIRTAKGWIPKPKKIV